MKKSFYIFIIFIALLKADGVIKSDFYATLGVGGGYYNYNEFNTQKNDAFIMRIDSPLFNVNASVGYIASGFKIEGYIDSNVSFGIYTGSNLYTNEYVKAIDFNSFHHINITLGYDVLSAFDSFSLYLQSGVRYYLNRNDSSPLERLQGYVAIPFEMEGQIALGDNWSFDFMGGYNLFLLGHHLSRGASYAMQGDLNVIQRQGMGARAFLGFSYMSKRDKPNSFRLVYEYWAIGDSPSARVYSTIENAYGYIREPKNTSHIFTLQYIFGF